MKSNSHDEAIQGLLRFPLIDALLGRRSRRFALGAQIHHGPLAFKSRHEPLPLDELEQMLVLLAASGTSGWNYLLMGNPSYAPHIANYAGSAGGRTFPSAAGFHTSELFFTDDDGTYFLSNRDAPAVFENIDAQDFSIEKMVDAHRQRIRKLRDTRLEIPRKFPHMEGHNYWIANNPGTTLVIPVADLAQHFLAMLCYILQSGYGIYDDIHQRQIPGLERFKHRVDLDNLYPLSYFEQLLLMEATVELSTSCYSGALMLQALGLGGWMYNGIDRHAILGISGDPSAPGLGFESVTDPRWTLPNPTRLPGVFEAMCPPNYPDMRSAVEAFAQRKFGAGGPYHPDTPGAWNDSPRVRTSAQIHDDEFKECVALQAQYVYDTFGKLPATSPSVLCIMYLQAHHLDLEFYDHFFKPGAYLQSHARHMQHWHGKAATKRGAA